uniref:Putative salivary lipocalin n=1 Tax=Ixodes ricinus TaxID=34613 RepID=A0A6B0V2T8_IXORI
MFFLILLRKFLFFFYNLIFQVLHYAFQLGFSQPHVASSQGWGTPKDITLRLVVYDIQVSIVITFRIRKQFIYNIPLGIIIVSCTEPRIYSISPIRKGSTSGIAGGVIILSVRVASWGNWSSTWKFSFDVYPYNVFKRVVSLIQSSHLYCGIPVFLFFRIVSHYCVIGGFVRFVCDVCCCGDAFLINGDVGAEHRKIRIIRCFF